MIIAKMWSRSPARVSGVIGGVKYVASRTAVVSNKTTKPASSKTTIGHEGRIATRRGRLSTFVRVCVSTLVRVCSTIHYSICSYVIEYRILEYGIV